jgi:hypothetical protein
MSQDFIDAMTALWQVVVVVVLVGLAVGFASWVAQAPGSKKGPK